VNDLFELKTDPQPKKDRVGSAVVEDTDEGLEKASPQKKMPPRRIEP
jgi:hypothetical protein